MLRTLFMLGIVGAMGYTLTVDETMQRFFHSPEPWQTYRRAQRTRVLVTPTTVITQDTAGRHEQWYQAEELIETARYGPNVIVDALDSIGLRFRSDTSQGIIVNSYQVGESIVKVHTESGSASTNQIDIIAPHDLYGDLDATYLYSNYKHLGGEQIPHQIVVRQLRGQLIDTITVVSVDIHNRSESSHNDLDSTDLEHLADRVSAVYLRATDTRSIVLEFADHILVHGVPLNACNGQMILDRVRREFPDKPVRTVSYGHFHPHYTGGIRPFVHAGATVISPRASAAYIAAVAGLPHTLCPDSLALDPQPLRQAIYTDSVAVGDTTLTAKYYTISAAAGHAIDFSILYLPDQQMVIQDELVWIKKDVSLEPASPRQRGLHDAIKQLNIPVKTIVSTWPVNSYNTRSIITFDELRRSVEMSPSLR